MQCFSCGKPVKLKTKLKDRLTAKLTLIHELYPTTDQSIILSGDGNIVIDHSNSSTLSTAKLDELSQLVINLQKTAFQFVKTLNISKCPLIHCFSSNDEILFSCFQVDIYLLAFYSVLDQGEQFDLNQADQQALKIIKEIDLLLKSHV